jgi:hypothetical protein
MTDIVSRNGFWVVSRRFNAGPRCTHLSPPGVPPQAGSGAFVPLESGRRFNHFRDFLNVEFRHLIAISALAIASSARRTTFLFPEQCCFACCRRPSAKGNWVGRRRAKFVMSDDLQLTMKPLAASASKLLKRGMGGACYSWLGSHAERR